MKKLSLQTDDGIKIGYSVYGTGEHSLLLIHGWMTSGKVFLPIINQLIEAGYQVVLPDLRGSGNSSAPETGYTLSNFVEDLIHLMDHLSIPKFSLIGHSMGGQIAQLLSAVYPQRIEQQVLLCPVPLSGLPLPEEALNLFKNAAGNKEVLNTILQMASLNLSPADKSQLLQLALPIGKACIVESLHAWSTGGFEEKLKQIKARTLVIASEDPFLPSKLLQQTIVDRIQNSRLQIIMKAGHYVQVEQSQETAKVICSFLAE